MRRSLLLLTLFLGAGTVAPLLATVAAHAQSADSDADKQKKKDEWSLKQAPLPNRKNAGPCPYVKILYDAARYEEFKDNKPASSEVAYTGEIEGLTADCSYKGSDPIHNKVAIRFALGRGPQARSAHKVYGYWVAVTHRNHEVLAKQEFRIPVDFPAGTDRVGVEDKINDIIIPRAGAGVSGENFEILVGFDVTPEMADFNRDGKRFRLNAGAPAIAEAQTNRQ